MNPETRRATMLALYFPILMLFMAGLQWSENSLGQLNAHTKPKPPPAWIAKPPATPWAWANRIIEYDGLATQARIECGICMEAYIR